MQFDPIEVSMTTAWADVTLPADIDGCRYYSARTAGAASFHVRKDSDSTTSYPVFDSEEFQDNTPNIFYKKSSVLFQAKMETGTDTLHVIISE